MYGFGCVLFLDTWVPPSKPAESRQVYGYGTDGRREEAVNQATPHLTMNEPTLKNATFSCDLYEVKLSSGIEGVIDVSPGSNDIYKMHNRRAVHRAFVAKLKEQAGPGFNVDEIDQNAEIDMEEDTDGNY